MNSAQSQQPTSVQLTMQTFMMKIMMHVMRMQPSNGANVQRLSLSRIGSDPWHKKMPGVFFLPWPKLSWRLEYVICIRSWPIHGQCSSSIYWWFPHGANNAHVLLYISLNLYWLFVTRDCVMCNRYLCWVCYWRYGVYMPNNNAPNRNVRTYVDYQMLVFWIIWINPGDSSSLVDLPLCTSLWTILCPGTAPHLLFWGI